MSLDEMDDLIGFGKPASKTADWIVNTYLPNAPVSYRLSIENAVATAIVEATRPPVESVPISALEAFIEREAFVPCDIDGIQEPFKAIRTDELSAFIEEFSK